MSFKRTFKTMLAALVISTGLAANAQAGEADACSVTLCMFGKLTGNSGGDECKSSERKFFSIEVKKKGKFRADKTYDARKSYMQECPDADPASNDKILGKFGKVRG